MVAFSDFLFRASLSGFKAGPSRRKRDKGGWNNAEKDKKGEKKTLKGKSV